MAGNAYPAGYYGKLPARGDFITRSLAPQFVNSWDAWLQQAIRASRERLKDAWLESYLSAPLWRFLLPPGLLMPQAVAGVFCPSVDRIGRHFPFTIAALLGPDPLNEVGTFVRTSGWFAAVEEVALAGLDPALDLDRYGERNDQLAFPGDSRAPTNVSPSGKARGAHLQALVQDEASYEATLRSLVQQVRPAGCALWLTAGSETIADCALATDGLPSPERFAAMLDGRFVHHGWDDALSPRSVVQPDA